MCLMKLLLVFGTSLHLKYGLIFGLGGFEGSIVD